MENLNDFDDMVIMNIMKFLPLEDVMKFAEIRPSIKQHLWMLPKVQYQTYWEYDDAIDSRPYGMEILGLYLAHSKNLDFNKLETGLEAACEQNNVEHVRALVERGAQDTQSAFHTACKNGFIDIVRYLAFVDTMDIHRGSRTAFHYGRYEVVKFLVDNRREFMYFPLNEAIRRDHFDVFLHLLDYDISEREKEKALIVACKLNKYWEVHELLVLGVGKQLNLHIKYSKNHVIMSILREYGYV